MITTISAKPRLGLLPDWKMSQPRQKVAGILLELKRNETGGGVNDDNEFLTRVYDVMNDMLVVKENQSGKSALDKAAERRNSSVLINTMKKRNSLKKGLLEDDEEYTHSKTNRERRFSKKTEEISDSLLAGPNKSKKDAIVVDTGSDNK